MSLHEKEFSQVYCNLQKIAHKPNAFRQKLKSVLKAGFPIDYIPSETDPGKRITLLFDCLRDDLVVLTETPDILIEYGADINIRDSCGWTALHQSFVEELNIPERVRKIIDAGADVNAVTLQGKTPFYLAACNFANAYCMDQRNIKAEEFDVFKILLDAGADPYLCNFWEENQEICESYEQDDYYEKRKAELRKFVMCYTGSITELNASNCSAYEYAL